MAADAALRAARADRTRPGRDDKVVTAWNGLALRALAEAAAVLADSRYLAAAHRLAEFAVTGLRRPDGRLVRSWRLGRAGGPGFCDDYGALAVGLYTLYQATGDERWFTEAERLTTEMVDLFADPDEPGFFATGHDAESLITRPKNLMDNPTPSDNAVAAEALQLHAALTGDPAARHHIESIAAAAGRIVDQYPSAAGHLIAVLATAPAKEVAVVGAAALRHPFEAAVWQRFRPDCVVATGTGAPSSIPLLADRSPGPSGVRAFVCRDFVCDLPTNDLAVFEAQLSNPVAGP
jgi:uncharacterized protein YyaL (SSP411 family)